MKNVDIQEIIIRIGFFKNVTKLSARELSLRIGKHDTYVNKLESKGFNLPVSVLLEIIAAFDITCEEFFADNYANYRQDKELTNIFKGLSADSKDTIKALMQKLKQICL